MKGKEVSRKVLIQYCEESIGVNDIDGHCPRAADWLVNWQWSCHEHVAMFLYLDGTSEVRAKATNPILSNGKPLAQIKR